MSSLYSLFPCTHIDSARLPKPLTSIEISKTSPEMKLTLSQKGAKENHEKHKMGEISSLY